ncbi:MAG: response regulator [Chlorobiaceae bacterium]|nr:response regulator [Chlorobiaceae bacterium]
MTKPMQACRNAATILLVDDEPDIVTIFTEVLEKAGHRVLPSTEPAQALDIAEQATEDIDLLLSDVTMPEMNGFELARRLKAMRPGLKVLFMSGYIEGTHCIDEGTVLLHKPLSLHVLCDAVSTMLDTAKATSPPE